MSKARQLAFFIGGHMARKSLLSMIKNAQNVEDIASKFKDDFIYTNEHLEESHAPSKTISPSGMNCQRAMSLKLLGVPKDSTKTNQVLNMICEIGTSMHEYVQKNCLSLKKFNYVDVAKYVKEKGLDLEIGKACNFDEGIYETHLYKLDKDGNKVVSFLCDGILQDKDTDKYYILEIKTTGSQGFFKQDGVLEKHRKQATAYSILLNIPTVVFMYICRDTPSIKAFNYTPTVKEKQELSDICNLVIEKARKNIIVAKPSVEAKDCAYCDWKKTCKTLGEGEVEQPS